MHSPLVALVWEIWRRGCRSACLVLGCISACAVINLALLDKLRIPPFAQNVFPELFTSLMILSFLLLLNVFNYTEVSVTREWSGFPYRLFALPVSTWKLVALPTGLAVLSVELVYLAWLKLVWTHQLVVMPEWFAVVLGVYMVFYLTALWTLAGFRILRIIVLTVGGASSIVVACLPFLLKTIPLPLFSEKYLIGILTGLSLLAFAFATNTVARQRSGGGRRRNWLRALYEMIRDSMPRRRADFISPGAAQFWFEWQRSGWLLPACTAFTLLAFIGPISWFNRDDPRYTIYILGRLLCIPLILAFFIGKGFVKCDFWSANILMPSFMAVRPLRAGEFVISKLKVAALSVLITWLLLLVFLALWLPLWADTAELSREITQFRSFYPHASLAIAVLFLFGLMVLTWRCLVSGLWAGLSGKSSYYFGAGSAQVLVPTLLLVAIGIWSDDIDRVIQNDPDLVKSVILRAISWIVSLLVIAKLLFAAVTWARITPRRIWQYLLLWSGATVCFITLAILLSPSLETYRLQYISMLAALLVFPLARLGLAPASLAMNRHR